ncbi:glutaredoxin [Limnohabitans sp. 2KL-1]|jgi:monothiol glutaredoxin|uniref:glutaredoxin domain-containing protein n=1 Tax=Limnohabitans sp. 2KL-1 TaxID=1100699 RepID=UPI000D3A7601|nr:glutaredoxin domain-containing protein [Limnohabitans sp. 2KL-1]PUE44801.1 glutaredoxin [Limnohabitans sp. 2KL-1]
MNRPILDDSAVHPAIRARISDHHRTVIQQVQAAIAVHPVVVVGMAGNPFVSKARNALTLAGVSHEYMAFGSYLSQWRLRNALKMWTGWPTFPMVFVRGKLVGGADDLRRLLDSGEFQSMLSS